MNWLLSTEASAHTVSAISEKLSPSASEQFNHKHNVCMLVLERSLRPLCCSKYLGQCYWTPI